MRKLYGLVALAGIALATACTDSSGPSGGTPQFSRQISFPDLQTKLQGLPANGAARAEIELPPTGLVAREVNVEDHQQVDDRETVRGRISALTVDAGGASGTLTLAPGFTVTFTSSTVFEAGDDMSLTLQQFVDRVQGALGQSPAVNLGVRAERSPLNPLALGPANAFPARKLELKPDLEHPKLKINVTQANLVSAGDGDCTMAALGVTPVGCLKVLGVTVGITNETELRAMKPGVLKAEFEGLVDCAKPIDASSFFLKSGAQVLVDEHTRVEGEGERGDDEHLTLAGVQTACGATPAPKIEAEGEGVLVSGNGEAPVIRATEVNFEREEDEAIEVEFTGMIDAIGSDNITVSGRVVRVDAATRIERDGDGDGDDNVALSDLHQGETVEVKAVVDATGALLAREIKVRS
ncbi:MAG TPA: DUF5666 domain-containing protein [Gemmatimonadales bacterium]|jgi:hypothetical protein